MKRFRQHLSEAAFSAADAKRAEKLIVRVLERKVGHKFMRYPGIEKVVSNGKKKQGLRYFLKGTFKCVRFNWTKKHGKQIESVDIWDGTGRPDKPTVHIKTSEFNIVQAIDKIAELIKSPKTGVTFTVMTEAKVGQDKVDYFARHGINHAEFKASKQHQLQYRRERRDIHKKLGLYDKPGQEGGSGSVTVKATTGKTEIVTDSPDIKAGQVKLDKITPDEMFSDLASLVDMVVKGNAPSLLVTGMAGSGKTYTVLERIKKGGLAKGQQWVLKKGAASPFGLYSTLYYNLDKLIVFDDCDSVFSKEESRNILKAALDSYDVREISWTSKVTVPRHLFDEDPDRYLDAGKLPSDFEFLGQIIFISNIPESKIEPAILSRSFTIEIMMTGEELVDRMAVILPDVMPEVPIAKKEEVLDYMREHEAQMSKRGQMNFRTLLNSIKLQQTDGSNWKGLAERYA